MKNVYANIILGVAICCLLLSIVGLCGNNRKVGNAENGILDLSQEELSEEIITLNGEWDFYPNTYYDEVQQKGQYIIVPKAWNHKKNKELHMKRYGCGTYHLTLKVKESGNYVLYVPFIGSAYKILVDGQVIAENGILGEDAQKEKAIWNPQNVLFTAKKNQVELIIWVSNYECRKGGIFQEIILGSYEKITHDTIFQVCRSSLFMGMFLGLGIYLLLCYIPKKQYAKCLYLGIFCFCCFLLEAFIGSYVARILFGSLSYRILLRIEYLVYIGANVSLTIFIAKSFPKEKMPKFLKSVVIADGIYMTGLILLRNPYFNLISCLNYYILAYNLLYVLFVLVKAMLHKRNYAMLSIYSLGIIVITILIDVFDIIKQPYSFSKSGFHVLGLICFLLCQMYILSRDNLETYEQSNQAKDMEIAFLQAQIAPHFFFNTLNTIYCMMNKNVEQAKELVLDFSTFLRVKHKFDYRNNITYCLYEEIDFISSYVKIENTRYNQLIKMKIDVSEEFRNIQIPQLTLQPIVENAIKHGFQNKQLMIRITCRKVETMLEISIEDNGKGMGKEFIRSILQDSAASHGIGLKNINYRLDKCYHTSLKINSEVAQGTTIQIMIPMKYENEV